MFFAELGSIGLEGAVFGGVVAGFAFGIPGALYTWLKHGDCNWGRHNYGKWSVPVDRGNYPTDRYKIQQRTCKDCGYVVCRGFEPNPG